MGRKSKLTDAAWEAIAARLRGGETVRELGREFGVSEATIRWRLPALRVKADAAADDGSALGSAVQASLPSLEPAQAALRLPSQASLRTLSPGAARSSAQASSQSSAPFPLTPSAQTVSRQLAATLLVVTDHLSGAALTGAEMARCLAEMAQEQVAQLGLIAQSAQDGSITQDSQRAAPSMLVEAIKRIQLLTAASNNAAELGMNLLKANKELTHAETEPTPVTIAFTVKDARVDADDNIFAEPAAGQVPAAAA